MPMDTKAILDAANLIVHALDDTGTIEADGVLDDVRRMIWQCAYLGSPIDWDNLADHPRHRRVVDILAGMRMEDANLSLDTARRGLWGGRLSVATGQVHSFGDKMETVTVSRYPAAPGQAGH